MKRLLAALLALCLMMPIAALGEESPLLYKVTDGEGHQLYLYGTIHVGDKDTRHHIAPLLEMLQQCDILAVEIDIIALQSNLGAAAEVLQSTFLKQGDSISNYLSEKTVALGNKLFDEPKAYLARLTPFYWLSMANELVWDKAGLSGDDGVDMRLILSAYSSGKTVESLESYAEQLAVYDAVSLDLIDLMIYDTLTHIDQFADEVKQMYDAWCVGDVETLIALQEAEDDGIPPELRAEYDKYIDLVNLNRNEAFEQDAVRLLKSGKTALIAIGLLHIIGEDGLAARMEKLGYTVEVVTDFYLSARNWLRAAN